jgi:hypothetical protein
MKRRRFDLRCFPLFSISNYTFCFFGPSYYHTLLLFPRQFGAFLARFILFYCRFGAAHVAPGALEDTTNLLPALLTE